MPLVCTSENDIVDHWLAVTDLLQDHRFTCPRLPCDKISLYPNFLERYSGEDVEKKNDSRSMTWREDEIETLLFGITKYGRKWVRLAEIYGMSLRNRSSKQLKDKWRRLSHLSEDVSPKLAELIKELKDD